MSTVNPNRARLLSPIDYLAILAGAQPPDPEPPMPVFDVPFRVHPYPRAPAPPMPFAEPPPQANPFLPVPQTPFRGF